MSLVNLFLDLSYIIGEKLTSHSRFKSNNENINELEELRDKAFASQKESFRRYCYLLIKNYDQDYESNFDTNELNFVIDCANYLSLYLISMATAMNTYIMFGLPVISVEDSDIKFIFQIKEYTLILRYNPETKLTFNYENNRKYYGFKLDMNDIRKNNQKIKTILRDLGIYK